jgi:flagellar biosynthesis/type III secretory pathway chaperone
MQLTASTDRFESAYKSFEAISGLYRELMNLSMKEKDLIIYEDMQGLTDNIMAKEELLYRIRDERELLKETIGAIKADFGYGEEEVPIQRIIALLPEEWKMRFERVFMNLRESTNNIRTISLINRKLINDTMKFINYVVGFLKKGDGEISMYSAKGSVYKKSNELSFLDVQL